ncbi:MAG: hypothetical protein Kow0068_26630 [Marinilabiliales bacterium]
MKNLIIVFIIIAVNYYTYSQEVHGGVTIGANLCTVDDGNTNNDEYVKTQLGGRLGFPVNIPVYTSGIFGASIQPELNFTMKGSRTEVDENNKSSYYYNYVEVPVMTKFRFGPEKFKFFVNTGPYFAYHVTYFYSTTFLGNTTNSDAETPDTERMNLMDIGWNIGAGFNISGVMIEARYGLGFSNINKDYELLGQTIDMTSKNRVLSFSIGFLIPE